MTGRELEEILLKDLIKDSASGLGQEPAAAGMQASDGEACFRKWGRPDQWHRFFVGEAVARNVEDSFRIVNSGYEITMEIASACSCMLARQAV